MKIISMHNRHGELNRFARRVSLYEVSLCLLVFSNDITRLSVWSAGSWVDTIVNVIQLGIYLLLFVLIIKRRFSTETFMLVALSLVLFVIGFLTTRDAVYIRDLLLIVAAKDIPFNCIVKSIRYSLTIVVVVALLSVVFGCVDVEVYRRGGYALGFAHPNQAALTLTIILLLWLAERHDSLKASDLLLACCATFVTYYLTRSRTALLLSVFAVGVSALYKQHPRLKMRKAFLVFIVFLPVISLLFTVLTAYLLPSSRIVNHLDLLLSNRIFLNWYAIGHHGMSLFGQIVDLTEGSGTTYNEIRGIWNSLITVDNSYTLSLVSLGIMPTLVFTAWCCHAQKTIVAKGDYFLLLIAGLFYVYGLTEAQMIDVFNNFMLLFTFAAADRGGMRGNGVRALQAKS